MKAQLAALAAGLIFGVGLCLSGMTNPNNVLAFLDVTGQFSPNLAGVMIGAIAVHASWLRWGARRPPIASALSPASALPPNARIDRPLVAGAALFGIGWGLGGYCPGPALVALGTGARAPAVFVIAMALGMLAMDTLQRPTRAPLSTPNAPNAAE